VQEGSIVGSYRVGKKLGEGGMGAVYIGEHTLRNHLSRIYDKLGVPNRVELFVFAQRHGVPGRTAEQRKPRAKGSRLKARALSAIASIQ